MARIQSCAGPVKEDKMGRRQEDMDQGEKLLLAQREQRSPILLDIRPPARAKSGSRSNSCNRSRILAVRNGMLKLRAHENFA